MPNRDKVEASVLKVRDLSIHYGDKKLLKSINFSINPGEVVAVIGANGAGKSTLLNTIIDGLGVSRNGFICRGEINFLDQAIESITAHRRAQQLALLPQTSHLPFPFTVQEVVALGRTPHSTGNKIDQQIVHSLLARLDIDHLAEQMVPQLSGGERQRVHLARVLAQLTQVSELSSQSIPRLLLLDEPCNALDMQHQQLLLDSIKQLKAENIAVLLVSHDLNWAIQCADRFLALKQGELIAEGDAEAVITTKTLREIYNIETSILIHPKTKRPVVLM